MESKPLFLSDGFYYFITTKEKFKERERHIAVVKMDGEIVVWKECGPPYMLDYIEGDEDSEKISFTEYFDLSVKLMASGLRFNKKTLTVCRI